MNDLSRRTVMKGAAWSVPVIVLAAAVPAYAASMTEPALTPRILLVSTDPESGDTVVDFTVIPTGLDTTDGIRLTITYSASTVEDIADVPGALSVYQVASVAGRLLLQSSAIVVPQGVPVGGRVTFNGVAPGTFLSLEVSATGFPLASTSISV